MHILKKNDSIENIMKINYANKLVQKLGIGESTIVVINDC